MNTFLRVTEVVLLIASVFFGISCIGANTEGLSERCGILSVVFTAALTIIIVAEMLMKGGMA